MLLIFLLTTFLIQVISNIRNMTMFGNSTLGYYYIEAFVG